MTAASPHDLTREGMALVLKRLYARKATNLAVEMKTSDSTISKLKNDSLESVIRMLAHLGLRVVDARAMVVDPGAVSSIINMHRRTLDLCDPADILRMQDDEEVDYAEFPMTKPGEL